MDKTVELCFIIPTGEFRKIWHFIGRRDSTISNPVQNANLTPDKKCKWKNAHLPQSEYSFPYSLDQVKLSNKL